VVDVDDLMHQMGADTHGRVSYEQFLQCRLSHKTEIEALRTQNSYPAEPTPELRWMNSKDLASGEINTSQTYLKFNVNFSILIIFKVCMGQQDFWLRAVSIA
jgi:hypothetical protein